ncbi:hypothetical protein KXW40_004990 [Aspergillus fumigatus]|nr:hypothetical protein KXW40_004990 [Aspergillus fumigatus]KAH2637527.1 hypothetical protein KXW54_000490 [Aspergillus fumigatus]KAH2697867.1 hypothetical protein KXV96_000116 [Aspergillus fumigatus]
MDGQKTMNGLRNLQSSMSPARRSASISTTATATIAIVTQAAISGSTTVTVVAVAIVITRPIVAGYGAIGGTAVGIIITITIIHRVRLVMSGQQTQQRKPEDTFIGMSPRLVVEVVRRVCDQRDGPDGHEHGERNVW